MLRLLREAGWQIRLDCIFIYLENIIPLEKCYDIISIVGAAAAIVGWIALVFIIGNWLTDFDTLRSLSKASIGWALTHNDFN